MQRATIIADASWCPDTKVAGYGFHISSDHGKRPGQGVFNDPCKGSNHAEAMALINALYVGCRTGLIRPGMDVLLQSDSQAALDALSGKRKIIFGAEKRCRNLLRSVADRLCLEIRFKHVPGHTDPSYSQGRFVANRLCDKRAKEQMRKARQRFKLGQIKEELLA